MSLTGGRSTVPAAAHGRAASRFAPSRSRSRRRGFDRPRFLWVVSVAVLVFLFVPVIVVAVYSFNGDASLVNLRGLSLRWYSAALSSGGWRSSLWVSVEIALITTAFCSTAGTALAFGIQRGERRVARVSNGTLMLRLVCPETATAVASLLLFTQLGLTLSRATIVAAHVAVCLPFVTVVVRSRLAVMNPEVERSAMDLGATRPQALRLVSLPMLLPAIGAASILVFVLSFDDFITTFFTAGIGVPPLPLRIYGMLKFGVTPVVNAVGIMMLVIAAVGMCGVVALLRITRRWSTARVGALADA
jgi:spermidine/putrescine transport system permease protein